MNRDEYIREQLNKHYLAFREAYPNTTLFALCLQGSQNYNLDIYTNEYKSDIDTKAIIVPDLKDVVLNKKPISTTHVLPNNEHIDIKDIRLMFESYKKQNVNFIETLFTKFFIVNPLFADEWNKLIINREEIAHYNTNQALRCISGMSMEKRNALCHPYPTLLDKIEKYGYDGKQLHHIIRMNDFILAYIEGKAYKDCLTFLPHKKEMMKAKLNQYTKYEALVLAQDFDNYTKFLKDKYLKPQDEINKNALNILNEVQYETIKKHFKMEVEE